MSEHPEEILLAIAAGSPPPPAAHEHLDGCDHCRRVLATLVPVNLDRVWAGVRAEVNAPKSRLLERLGRLLGLSPSLARFIALTPTLSISWLLAGTLTLLVGLALPGAAGLDAGSTPLVVLAPLVAAAAVAFSYGPAVDPAYSIVAVTPLSPVRALLARLAVVLGVNAVVAMVLDLVIARDGIDAGWLLPMAAVALLAAVVASWSTPVTGAATGIGVWLAIVLSRVSSGGHLSDLTAGGSQVVWAVAALVLLAVVTLRSRTRRSR